MKNYIIAERYAKALHAWCPAGEIDALSASLRRLAQAYAENEMLRNVLNSPAVDLAKRVALLEEAGRSLALDSRVVRLAVRMVARGRIGMLSIVSFVFSHIGDKRLGRTRAVITSAIPLTSEQEDRLTCALSKWCGKPVLACQELNVDILGGVTVRMDGTVVDASVRTLILRLRERLLSQDIRLEASPRALEAQGPSGYGAQE